MPIKSILTITSIISWLAACACWYRTGFNSGRRDTIHQLFSGEQDFKQFIAYRRTGGHDAELLQKLINCLRNDYDMVAEWDGLRRVWTIEVPREGCDGFIREVSANAAAEVE